MTLCVCPREAAARAPCAWATCCAAGGSISGVAWLPPLLPLSPASADDAGDSTGGGECDRCDREWRPPMTASSAEPPGPAGAPCGAGPSGLGWAWSADASALRRGSSEDLALRHGLSAAADLGSCRARQLLHCSFAVLLQALRPPPQAPPPLGPSGDWQLRFWSRSMMSSCSCSIFESLAFWSSCSWQFCRRSDSTCASISCRSCSTCMLTPLNCSCLRELGDCFADEGGVDHMSRRLFDFSSVRATRLDVDRSSAASWLHVEALELGETS
mmetsp:Transcript_37122/g.104746  ORF Transcript_37122/g.104746 Transcript_37122/m.104746 type:complete len:271 (+) Transcript_37122:361-1173(+)